MEFRALVGVTSGSVKRDVRAHGKRGWCLLGWINLPSGGTRRAEESVHVVGGDGGWWWWVVVVGGGGG